MKCVSRFGICIRVKFKNQDYGFGFKKSLFRLHFMGTIKKQDEIIEHLLNSKKELQEEIRNDVHTKEFQVALKELRVGKELKLADDNNTEK